MSRQSEAKKARRNKRRAVRDASWVPRSTLDELSDDIGIAAELLFPKLPRDQHGGVMQVRVFLRIVESSQNWANSHHAEELLGRSGAVHNAGRAVTSPNLSKAGNNRRHSGEDRVLIAIVTEVRTGRRPASVAQRSRMRGDDIKTSRIGKMQRRKQNVREDAENGRIDADTQREHQHRGGVEPGRAPHSSQRISEVSK